MLSNKIIPIRDQIAEQIRSDIIAGDLAPTTKLNEQALADRFGVSRGPIRDVLLQLTKEGLLVSKSNCGVSVNSTLSPDLQDLMIDMRIRIETYAIKQVIGKLSEDDFENLEQILHRLAKSFKNEDFTEVTKLDIAFHQYIVQQAGGDELTNLWYPIVMRMHMNYKRLGSAKACVNEHQAIIDALKKKELRKATAALKENIK
ncbi:GntR family transcriptional regulator [Agarilytica rhodophyticola]|uniref:GntR family transcriptional regulator n=1 Tax=Agarilytica rhodophyticola TaxID=1737490 RepID=UPI000B348D1D|nr:GntR family transcriptional regulator [Agarilytica rhodophyticola]